jgi:protein involved in polysaccharide export with SLBB domain
MKSTTESSPGRRRAATALLAILLVLSAACGPKTAPMVEPIHEEPGSAAPGAVGDAAAPRFVPVPVTDLPAWDAASIQAAAEGQASAPYTVSVRDLLEISVYGDPDLTRQVPVRPDGMISFTFVGDVRAAGRTIEEIRAELKTRLGAYLRTPEVTVIAREFAAKKVYVGGEIRSPGVYSLGPGMDTLADVVFQAGLTTEFADVSRAVLVRDGRLVPADFVGLLRGDLSHNVVLQDNDLIHVPEATERFVYVLGEVRSPTAVETSIPRTLVDVLSKAGGPIVPYAKTKQVAVLRGGLREPTVALVNYKRLIEGDLSQNIQVNPGDIVYVPPTGLTTYSRFIEQILRTFNLFFQARVVQEAY